MPLAGFELLHHEASAPGDTHVPTKRVTAYALCCGHCVSDRLWYGWARPPAHHSAQCQVPSCKRAGAALLAWGWSGETTAHPCAVTCAPTPCFAEQDSAKRNTLSHTAPRPGPQARVGPRQRLAGWTRQWRLEVLVFFAGEFPCFKYWHFGWFERQSPCLGRWDRERGRRWLGLPEVKSHYAMVSAKTCRRGHGHRRERKPASTVCATALCLLPGCHLCPAKLQQTAAMPIQAIQNGGAADAQCVSTQCGRAPGTLGRRL